MSYRVFDNVKRSIRITASDESFLSTKNLSAKAKKTGFRKESIQLVRFEAEGWDVCPTPTFLIING